MSQAIRPYPGNKVDKQKKSIQFVSGNKILLMKLTRQTKTKFNLSQEIK